MLEQIEQTRSQALAELARASDAAALEQWRARYLSKKGQVQSLLSRLGGLAADVRPRAGQQANRLRADLTEALERRKGELSVPAAVVGPRFDVTLPGRGHRLGRLHPITQTIGELCEIFGRMGFQIAYGPEVEDEFHSFEALNIPPANTARDPLDNFFLTDGRRLLRSHTSTVQIRVMESQRPPVRIVAPGRVYRPDTVDARHSFMFHQIEGLYVDERVTMADLKSCLNQFVNAFYGPEVRTRFRPSFFPFTEPSAELDILWSPDASAAPRWMELGGCGMVDPAVFQAVGYDPDRYSGFAFGFGIERTLMAKYSIPDIRLLFEGDVRFLSQW